MVKKRDLVLDFTSLLDVIMIILFVVLAGVGQASIDAKEELKVKKEENQFFREALVKKEEDKSKLEKKNMTLADELSKLLEDNKKLAEENKLLQATSSRMDLDPRVSYENLMKKSLKFTLVCTPFVASPEGNKDEVEVKLYLGTRGKDQEALSRIVIEHDFSLTPEERVFKNERMKEELYQILERSISYETELLLFTVQFTYEDKNFSQSDLDIIEGAIKDLERRKSKTCFIEKVRL